MKNKKLKKNLSQKINNREVTLLISRAVGLEKCIYISLKEVIGETLCVPYVRYGKN
jgi:hypothetical protein